MKSVKPTKGQEKLLRNQYGVGTGVVMYKSGEDEITYVDFFLARNGSLRNVRSGLPLKFEKTAKKRYEG